MKPFFIKSQVRELLIKANVWNERVEEALLRAILSHRYHVRDDGTPYLEQHIFPIVARIVERYKDKKDLEDLVILAFLHDAYEKDPYFSIDVVEEYFGKKIAEDIVAITEQPKRGLKNTNERMEANRVYVQKILKSSENVRIVKLESWLNNMQTTELLNDIEKYNRLLLKAKDLYLPVAETVAKEYIKEFNEEIKRLQELSNQRN